MEGIVGHAPKACVLHIVWVFLFNKKQSVVIGLWRKLPTPISPLHAWATRRYWKMRKGILFLSNEKGDRSNIGLPAARAEFIKKLATSGAKIILVLCGGGPIALGELEDLVEAVLFIWYPGQAGGEALARILFGDVSPSGKFPITFPKSIEQLPAFYNYHMENRTYRYSSVEPLYAFGFGLSYTDFEYENLKLSTKARPGGKFTFFECGNSEYRHYGC